MDSKLWRFIIVFYFLITIPLILFFCFAVLQAPESKIFHYELESAYITDCILAEDEKEMDVCNKWLELAKLIKWNAWQNGVDISNLNDGKTILDSYIKWFPDKSEALYNYTHTDRYSDIWDFAEKEGLWEYVYEHDYKRWMLYVILLLLVYVVLTDLFRWMAYYIYTWKFQSLIWNKIKVN